MPIKDPEGGYVRRAMKAQKEKELLNDNVGQMRTIEKADDYNYLTPVQQRQKVMNDIGVDNTVDNLEKQQRSLTANRPPIRRGFGDYLFGTQALGAEEPPKPPQVMGVVQPKQTWGKGIGNAVNQAGKYITQPVQQEESFKDQILKILAQGATRTALQIGQYEIQKRAPQHAPYTGQMVNEVGGLIPGWQEQEQGQKNNPYAQWENNPAYRIF